MKIRTLRKEIIDNAATVAYKTGFCLFHGKTLVHRKTGRCLMCKNELTAFGGNILPTKRCL